jgi:PelA/Pel-15E family pectate lyase
MYLKNLFIPVLLLFSLSVSQAQNLRVVRNDLFHDDSLWYGGEASRQVAENVLLLQHDNGGWPKNIKFYNKVLTAEEKAKYQAEKADRKETTIDNNATYAEIVFLAKMYQATKNEVYKDAFTRGLNFVHSLQYVNGGFRQFDRTYGYYTHITYNDNAMLDAILLMHAVANGEEQFAGMLSSKDQLKAKQSFEKGVDCILKTQYVQNGKKTVWCAQHDEKTLLPAKARAYELPSLSGSESVGLVQLLMNIPNPSAEVKEAVNSAMAWFDANRIKDHRIGYFTNADNKPDMRWEASTQGDDLWGRFNELDTNRPFVCDRDGIIKYDISEIGYERRNGYGWYTSAPGKLFAKYAKWKEKNQ